MLNTLTIPKEKFKDSRVSKIKPSCPRLEAEGTRGNPRAVKEENEHGIWNLRT